MKNIELKDIEAARAALPASVRRTPIIPLARDSAEIGRERCFLKCENLQVTGAFKVRAAFTMLNALPEQLPHLVQEVQLPRNRHLPQACRGSVLGMSQ